MTDESRNRKYAAKYGAVCMLDALGVKNLSIKSSADFLDNIEKMKPGMRKNMETYFKKSPGERLGKEILHHYESQAPELITFGDTVILIWELTDTSKPEIFLLPTAHLASTMIIEGIHNGILFRGALSIGEYIRHASVVIGPAISDVASWYEEGNWIGAVLTPCCGQFISGMNEAIDRNKLDATSFYVSLFKESFIPYDVPLTGDSSKKLWALAWPRVLTQYGHIMPVSKLHWYYQSIQKLSIPKGTEDKYTNTEAFLKIVLSKMKDKRTAPK